MYEAELEFHSNEICYTKNLTNCLILSFSALKDTGVGAVFGFKMTLGKS